MTRSTPEFQRARRPEHKQQRRDAILTAARQLAVRDGVRAVSLSDIAGAVGIHKSALLRYFETREEIFLELAAAAWRDWEAGLSETLTTADRKASATRRKAFVAATLGDSFASRPLFCDLLVHTPLNLERHVSVDAVRRYKLQSLGSVQAVSRQVHGFLPEINEPEARELVSALATITGSLWQIANPPAVLAELYRSDPELAHACVEVRSRLQRTAEVMLAGFPATR
jgi:AcrR family transcriptional regulator